MKQFDIRFQGTAFMQIMLSELQQGNVWEGWLGSEIRANYFADLCRRYQQTQRFITWMILVTSSGATFSFLAQLPQEWLWVRFALAVLTAAGSLWSLIANYNKNVTDCSDLHFRWKQLGIDYEDLWGDMYARSAPKRLSDLRQREAELSKSGMTLPNKKRMMIKWQRYVQNRHLPAT
jgi:hypothetical protein